jgi:hypothetical protein
VKTIVTGHHRMGARIIEKIAGAQAEKSLPNQLFSQKQPARDDRGRTSR